MNEIIPGKFRDINVITSEILMLQQQTQRMVLEYAIEVGRRLTEAKGLLPYGEWGKWIEEELTFSKSTANNLMQIYNEYGADQIGILGAEAKSKTLGKLSYSKALKLLAVPAEEREEFAEQHDVENISTRELDKLIKEKKAAEAEKDDALRKLGDAQIELESTKDKLSAAQAAEKQATERMRQAQEDVRAADEQAVANEKALKEKLEAAEKDKKAAEDKLKELKKKHKEEIEKLKNNQEIPQETIDKLRAEAEAKSADALAKADKELKEASEREDALRKQLQLAAPDTAIFKLMFGAVQEDFNKLTGLLLKIKGNDPETAAKLTGAVSALLEKMKEEIR